jgi:hypothetical protein
MSEWLLRTDRSPSSVDARGVGGLDFCPLRYALDRPPWSSEFALCDVLLFDKPEPSAPLASQGTEGTRRAKGDCLRFKACRIPKGYQG